MRRLASLALLLSIIRAESVVAAGRPMQIEDLLAVKTVSDPQISPDGKTVVYVLTEIDLPADKSNSDLWIVSTSGGQARRLTETPGPDVHPRWSPDGKSIAFVSSRSGSSQIWLIPAAGGEARQVTHLPIDVSGPIWSPKGDSLAFTAEVYPGFTPERTAARDKERAAAKSKARIYDSLMIRHWSTWNEGKFSHLFVAEVATGKSIDLTPEFKANIPPAPFGGSSDYAYSRDGAELAFTAEPLENPAWSTNTDIYLVSAKGGRSVNITRDNRGADGGPSYSPDGNYIAFKRQHRAGFESDQWVLYLKDRRSGENADLSSFLDRPVESFDWGASDKVEQGTTQEIFATIDSDGTEPIAALGYLIDQDEDVLQARRPHVVTGAVNRSAVVSRDGKRLVFVRSSIDAPSEIYSSNADGSELKALTSHNSKLRSELDLKKAELIKFKGADDVEVTGWLVKPPGFDPSRKYPVILIIHGGPQVATHDEWHARWSLSLFAARGYVVLALNPRGSSGFGQDFTDQISRDWNGRVFKDLMLGLDHALKTYPFLDEKRMAAAGGSFGGYMVNWIAGRDVARFKALISHAGVFDLGSKYGTTEELWFPEWEFGGTPWSNPTPYRSQSPSVWVKNFKTPTLVIHGALDYRVPDAQGLGMFTSLQRMGVPSRYVFFPDEGHWILKPGNRQLWWNEVFSWLEKHLR